MRAVVVLLWLSALAYGEPRPLVGVRVEGKTKVTETTATRLARLELGQPVDDSMLPQIEAALISSELFKTATAKLEEAPGGYTLVVTVVDKLSWIVAPTVYALPHSWSVGAGYAENNLFGDEKKLLLYGQVGNVNSLFFGTYFDPAVRGSQLQLRFDVYLVHRVVDEYDNDPANPTSYTIDRTSTWTFLDAGLLVGWRFYWWLIADARFKPAYAMYTDYGTGLPPDKDGWDVSVQNRLTLDRRQHRYGVTWGPFAQLMFETSVPGLDSYGYQLLWLRSYYSWRFFAEHELEIRVQGNVGRHLPFHDEITLGAAQDLRGYPVDMIRGDRRATARVEYSVPIFKWKMFAFRGIGFWDGGYVGFFWRDPSHRDYLPTQTDGSHWIRNDVGGGLRVYVGNVVLPLLGLDVAYGIEGRRAEVYFEVGLTDF